MSRAWIIGFACSAGLVAAVLAVSLSGGGAARSMVFDFAHPTNPHVVMQFVCPEEHAGRSAEENARLAYTYYAAPLTPSGNRPIADGAMAEREFGCVLTFNS